MLKALKRQMAHIKPQSRRAPLDTGDNARKIRALRERLAQWDNKPLGEQETIKQAVDVLIQSLRLAGAGNALPGFSIASRAELNRLATALKRRDAALYDSLSAKLETADRAVCDAVAIQLQQAPDPPTRQRCHDALYVLVATSPLRNIRLHAEILLGQLVVYEHGLKPRKQQPSGPTVLPQPATQNIAPLSATTNATRPPPLAEPINALVPVPLNAPPRRTIEAGKWQLESQKQAVFNAEVAARLAAQNQILPATFQRTSELTSHLGKHYYVLNRSGQGTRGKFKLGLSESGERVAIKEIRIQEKRKLLEAGGNTDQTEYTPAKHLLREVTIMQEAGAYLCPSDIIDIEGKTYIVMPLMDGDLFDAAMAMNGLSPCAVLSVLRQVAEEVQRCHDAGYLHCDIKQENILWNKKGKVVAADYGFAKPFNADGARVNKGTFATMAPETLVGKLSTPKSDVFSLGVSALDMAFPGSPFNVEEQDPALHREVRKSFKRWHARMCDAEGRIHLNRLNRQATEWDVYFKAFVDKSAEHRQLAKIILQHLLAPASKNRLTMQALIDVINILQPLHSAAEKQGRAAFQQVSGDPEREALFTGLQMFRQARQQGRWRDDEGEMKPASPFVFPLEAPRSLTQTEAT